jgi:hypothetical protein
MNWVLSMAASPSAERSTADWSTIGAACATGTIALAAKAVAARLERMKRTSVSSNNLGCRQGPRQRTPVDHRDIEVLMISQLKLDLRNDPHVAIF